MQNFWWEFPCFWREVGWNFRERRPEFSAQREMTKFRVCMVLRHTCLLSFIRGRGDTVWVAVVLFMSKGPSLTVICTLWIMRGCNDEGSRPSITSSYACPRRRILISPATWMKQLTLTQSHLWWSWVGPGLLLHWWWEHSPRMNMGEGQLLQTKHFADNCVSLSTDCLSKNKLPSWFCTPNSKLQRHCFFFLRLNNAPSYMKLHYQAENCVSCGKCTFLLTRCGFRGARCKKT